MDKQRKRGSGAIPILMGHQITSCSLTETISKKAFEDFRSLGKIFEITTIRNQTNAVDKTEFLEQMKSYKRELPDVKQIKS